MVVVGSLRGGDKDRMYVCVFVCAKKKQKKIAQFFIRDIKNIRVRRFIHAYRVCVRVVPLGFVNQSNVFFFLNRKSFYRFLTDIIVCLKQNKFLKYFDRGSNCVQFVLGSSEKEKKEAGSEKRN